MADRGWDGLSGSELKVLAAIVERFEDAWSTGTPPDLPTFLAEAGDDPATRPVVLEELVRIDLEYRWRTPRGDGHGIRVCQHLPTLICVLARCPWKNMSTGCRCWAHSKNCRWT